MSRSQWTIEYKHHVHKLQPGDRKGRNPLEGYARACGIQFGNVRQLCAQDPDFQEAMRLAQGRTIVLHDRLINLFLLFKFFLPRMPGNSIAEFGSYTGGSAIMMAFLAKRYLNGANVYAFDTFSGIPDADNQIDVHLAGDFGKVNLPELKQFIAANRLDNLHLVEGTFEKTLPDAVKTMGPLSLVHIDCDVQSSVAYCYEMTKALAVPGAYIVLDDPLTSTCLGAFEAMEELMIRRDGLHAEQAFPHMVFRSPKP